MFPCAKTNDSVGNRSDEGEDAIYLSLNEKFSVACAATMTVLCALGIFGNILSIMVFSHPKMRTSINMLLLALSCADLMLTMLTIPTFSLQGLNLYFHSPFIDRLQIFTPVTLYPVACITQSTSVWLMVAITGERFVAICKPLLARDICTLGLARTAVLIVLGAAIAYNMPRFFEFSLAYDDEITCDYRAQEWLRENTYYFNIYFVGIYLVTHFVVPFFLLVSCNICIVLSVRKAKETWVEISNRQKKEHHIAKMVCVIIAMFLICNTLPFVLNFAESQDKHMFFREETKRVAFLVLDVSNTLVVLNSASTFIIYLWFSEKYRQTAQHVLTCQYHYRTLSITSHRSVSAKASALSIPDVPKKAMSASSSGVSLKNQSQWSRNSSTNHIGGSLTVQLYKPAISDSLLASPDNSAVVSV